MLSGAGLPIRPPCANCLVSGTISLALSLTLRTNGTGTNCRQSVSKAARQPIPSGPLMVSAYDMSEGDPIKGGCDRRDELVLLRNWTTQPMCRDGLLDFGTRSSSIIKSRASQCAFCAMALATTLTGQS